MKNWIFADDVIFCWIFWCVDWNFWRLVWYFLFFDRHFSSISNESSELLMFRLYCVCFEFQSIWNDESKFFSNRMFRASKRAWIDWIWFVNWFWNKIVDCAFEKTCFQCFCWLLIKMSIIDWFDRDKFVKNDCFDNEKFKFRVFSLNQWNNNWCCMLKCCLTFWNCWKMMLMFFVNWFFKFWTIWCWRW